MRRRAPISQRGAAMTSDRPWGKADRSRRGPCATDANGAGRGLWSGEPSDRQFARRLHPDPGVVSRLPALSRLDQGGHGAVRRSSLCLAHLPDRRRAALFRLRPVLRLGRRASDGDDVLPLGAVRRAEPEAQGRGAIRRGPPDAARRALPVRRSRAHPAGDLSGVSPHAADGERRRLSHGLSRPAVLAERTAVVPMGVARVFVVRGRRFFAVAARLRTAGGACRRRGAPPAPAFS